MSICAILRPLTPVIGRMSVFIKRQAIWGMSASAWGPLMLDKLIFRSANRADASDLAILLDIASRRIVSWYWSTLASPGQSWLELGRDRILHLPERASHYSKWHLAESNGGTVGALFGFSVADPYEPVDLSEVEEPFRPLVELEMLASGCWLLQAIAIFPEFRRQGFGPVLVARACDAARAAGHRRIALQVESPNVGAIGLYNKCGFAECERRPYVPFPSSDDSGDWILMAKDL
jgi:ribosomal protein S18 acetylase RimI-like enzyme